MAQSNAPYLSQEGPTDHAERGALLLRVAALIERDKNALARAGSLDTGK
jgi:betaine-aldehyde dehydrogenase